MYTMNQWGQQYIMQKDYYALLASVLCTCTLYIHVQGPPHPYAIIASWRTRALAEMRPAHWVIVLHLGLEGCSQPRELWLVDILMYVRPRTASHHYLTLKAGIILRVSTISATETRASFAGFLKTSL